MSVDDELALEGISTDKRESIFHLRLWMPCCYSKPNSYDSNTSDLSPAQGTTLEMMNLFSHHACLVSHLLWMQSTHKSPP